MSALGAISIHAPREGGDIGLKLALSCSSYFNPRPPRWGRLQVILGYPAKYPISIHAPREGGDVQRFINSTLSPPISIHAPREGGDSKDAQFYLRIFDK